jgi:hypothetical protein
MHGINILKKYDNIYQCNNNNYYNNSEQLIRNVVVRSGRGLRRGRLPAVLALS